MASPQGRQYRMPVNCDGVPARRPKGGSKRRLLHGALPPIGKDQEGMTSSLYGWEYCYPCNWS